MGESQLPKIRLRIFSFVFLVGVGALLFKLFSWQVLKAGELSSQAKLQHQQGDKISAQRGNILSFGGVLVGDWFGGWEVCRKKPKIKSNFRNIANSQNCPPTQVPS